MEIRKKPLFNENGDIEVSKKKMINGNTTNLNDFNNMKYTWVSEWYRQAMNNFWIPEEINLAQDLKDYKKLTKEEKTAYDKILSFLIFLDSIQTANLGNINSYITASEVNLCLTIQAFQEAVHSQSYSYMLDSICSPEERNEILFQWKDDAILLQRNKFIGDLYNNFLEDSSMENFIKSVMANYILEGVYFYSGFMFFYNLERNGKMPGSAQEIRYINRDENTHLWLFRSIIKELKSKILDENKIAYVPKTINLFDDSIQNNITLFAPRDEELLKKVMEISCIDMKEFEELIKKEKYIGRNGKKLSEGQRQRVAIARALYSRNEILLLDNCFSNIDYVTSLKIIEGLNKHKYTMIVLATDTDLFKEAKIKNRLNL